MSGLNYLSDVKELHIELTDKCQASCPMCARNVNGGAERPFVGKNEITLKDFKKWFPESFLKSLSNFYSCGNYGDPILAKECLEIYQYVRSVNDLCRLSIHTNGSARNTDWWKSLSQVMGENHMVTFGIDGFEKSHSIYRRGTDWNKIIENAKIFIDNGGNAEVDCLVFKHNQHELEDFYKTMINIGFVNVNFKYTKRFYDMIKFPVEDKNGNFEYFLEPAVVEEPIQFLPLEKINENISIWEDIVSSANIKPKCIKSKGIYVDSLGTIFPCCWIGSDWIEQPIPEKITLQKLRNLAVENTKTTFSNFGIFNLKEQSISSANWGDLEKFFEEKKPWTCVKNCYG